MDPLAPFGGIKGSGYDRELGSEGLDSFSRAKAFPRSTSRRQHPASSAGMSLVTMRNWGMFQGTTAATTPTGCLRI
jgi:hypothetical protein